MAKGMRDIKRQIKSVQNTKQITKAMEMVAAAKLRRAQESAQSARPYAEKMKEVVLSIASGSNNIRNPLLQARPIKKTGYLVMTSDRGLAGAFNANVLRRTMQLIKENHKSTDEYSLFVIGRKGRDFFKKRGLPIVEEITGLPDSPKFADIKRVANKAVGYFIEQKFDALILVYNEFVNAITQRPVEKQLLPLVTTAAKSATSGSYEYEPSPEGVLETLLPRYAETLIFAALLESKASEFGSRMTAMGNATKNASKMIATLTLTYNRARQAAITQEISEIVAGANAQG